MPSRGRRTQLSSAAPALHRALCGWFAREARDLPWRRGADPYGIWISEAMLQQTRVAVVIDRWAAFVERFPGPAALAEASDDDLLAAWSGLGYYRRARALRDAARTIVARHGGRLPADTGALRELPGVGRYTAGAVASIAFGESAPIVDGNVARVFARVFGLAGAAGSPALLRAAWDLAAALVPAAGDGPEGPGAWNQALMELGALVCTPKRPRCGDCPLASGCAARASGRQEAVPPPRPRPADVEVGLELAVVRRGRDVLLLRRAAGGRLAGLLDLPTRERGTPRLFDADWPLALVVDGEPIAAELRHQITHHKIRARLVPARIGRGALPADAVWHDPAADDAPLSGLARKALRLIGG